MKYQELQIFTSHIKSMENNREMYTIIAAVECDSLVLNIETTKFDKQTIAYQLQTTALNTFLENEEFNLAFKTIKSLENECQKFVVFSSASDSIRSLNQQTINLGCCFAKETKVTLVNKG